VTPPETVKTLPHSVYVRSYSRDYALDTQILWQQVRSKFYLDMVKESFSSLLIPVFKFETSYRFDFNVIFKEFDSLADFTLI